jgi:outer membrane protein
MRIVSTYVFLFLVVFAQVGVGEELRLSLKDAIGRALENNNELRAMENSVSASRADVGVARSFLLPQLRMEENFVRTDNPVGVFSIKLNQERFTESDFDLNNLNNPDPVSDFETRFSVEQPILAVQEALAVKSANKEYLASAEEFGRQREYIAFRVFESYIAVETAKEFVRVAKKALEDAEEQLRIANTRYKTGLGLYSDTLRASTAATEAEQQLVSTEKNLSVAKRSLGLLLGLSDPVDTDAETNEKITLMEFDYYQDMSRSRKDLKALEYKQQSAKTNVRMAESGYLPKIGVMGSYQLNDENTPFGAEGDSWLIAGFLRWEIFNGGRREYERAKAKHVVKQTEESIKGMKKRVSLQVYESYLSVEESKKNVELAESSLKTAREGTRLVRKRYENSLSPFVDLLDAQVNLDRTRANLTAQKNEYRKSLAKLAFESGTILQVFDIED